MITHHPGEDLIASYAAGSLDEASSLALATHLTLCPDCRRQAADYERLGAALLEEAAEAEISSGALDATLARIRAAGPLGALAGSTGTNPAPGSGRLLPAPLRRYVGGDVDAARWRPLGPGIQHMPLISDQGISARLLRIAPGRSVFGHSHGGQEITLVLSGSYRSLGKTFTRGDIELADETVTHQPVAGDDETCICLAVTDAPLRFGNVLGRLMQPFIGI